MDEKSRYGLPKPHKPIARYDENVDDVIFMPSAVGIGSARVLKEKKLKVNSIAVFVNNEVDDSDSQLSIPRGYQIRVKSRTRSGHDKPQRSYTKVNRCRCDCCIFWCSAIKYRKMFFNKSSLLKVL